MSRVDLLALSIDDYPRQLLNALSELVLLGLQRADTHAARSWRELARFGESIGFHRLTRPVAALADALEQKSHTPPGTRAPPADRPGSDVARQAGPGREPLTRAPTRLGSKRALGMIVLLACDSHGRA